MKQVTVMGRKVKIKIEDIPEGAYGQFADMPPTITLAPEMPPELAARVMIHEMVHAALALSGIDYHLDEAVEEQICTVMETAVPDIMKALRRMKVEDLEGVE